MGLPCSWPACLAAGTGGKTSILDPEVEVPVISSALGSRQRFDSRCKQACYILQLQNIHLQQPGQQAQFNAGSDGLGLPLGLPEVAVWSVCWGSQGGELVALLQTEIFYSVTKVGSSSMAEFLFCFLM